MKWTGIAPALAPDHRKRGNGERRFAKKLAAPVILHQFAAAATGV